MPAQRAAILGVFIFIVTSVVYVTQYDITLEGAGGRLLAVVIMVVGVGLFLRLLQAIFRPNKVRFECPDCALLVHDLDAVHCKHCGRILQIPNEGL